VTLSGNACACSPLWSIAAPLTGEVLMESMCLFWWAVEGELFLLHISLCFPLCSIAAPSIGEASMETVCLFGGQLKENKFSCTLACVPLSGQLLRHQQ
jgi:hypothetical protein